MFYAICEGIPGTAGPAYTIYKFHTLESMKPCDAVNEYSIIYNGDSHRQLIDFCSLEELYEIATCLCGDVTFVSHQQAADYVHTVVVKKAKLWKPQEETSMSEVAQVVNEAPAPVVTEKKKQTRPRFNNEAKIKVLMDAPTAREGTNRYRNMKVIMESATVGEAMGKLRALTPAPGCGVDIKLALKAGVIELEE